MSNAVESGRGPVRSRNPETTGRTTDIGDSARSEDRQSGLATNFGQVVRLMDLALARSDIGQLAQRYAVAVDSKDISMLASLFMAPEGSDPAAFKQEIVQRFTANLAKVRLSFMNVGTHLIEEVGDTSATGLVYCKAEFVVADEWLEQAVLYRDTYAYRDGSWYFAERIHELWYGAPRGLNPLTLPPAEWPKRQIGMGTVPASWPSYQAFWNSTGPA